MFLPDCEVTMLGTNAALQDTLDRASKATDTFKIATV